MSISLGRLRKLKSLDQVIIHSIHQSLFQVSVFVDGREHYVIDDNGRPLRAFSKLRLQGLFENINVERMLLRHESAFDEMIGHEPKAGSNALEVLLGNKELAYSLAT